MAKPRKPKSNVKGIGGGRWKNTKKGSPRYGQVFTKGKDGSHVYTINGKRVVIGGKKPVAPPKPAAPKPDPYGPQVEEAITLKFGGAEKEVANEHRISDQQTANVGNWWAKYQTDVQAAAARSQAGYQQAQQQVYQQANTARAQDQGQSQQLDQSAQQDAAARGAVTGPSVAGQAQAGRQALSSSFGGLIGSQGATHNTFGQSQVANAGGIRASELQKEGQRKQLLTAKGTEMAKEKGSARVSLRRELEAEAEKAAIDEDERKWKRMLEAKTFDIRAQDMQADNTRGDQQLAAQKARDKEAAKARRLAAKLNRQKAVWAKRNQDRTYQLNRQKFGAAEADKRYKRAKGLGDYKPAAPKGGSGKTRSHKGYGKTNVTMPVAVTKRAAFSDLTARYKAGEDAPKSANRLLRQTAKAYVDGKGKVSKKLALRVYREFGFRLPYRKPGYKPPGAKKTPTQLVQDMF